MTQEQTVADTFDPATVTWVFTDEDLARLLVDIESAVEIVADVQTTSLDEHRPGAAIVVASFTLLQPDQACEPTTWVLPLSHPESPFLGKWVSAMRQAAQATLTNGAVGGHNFKFDARWIYVHTGVDLAPVITWDSQISAHLLDENRSTKLKDVAPATFGVERWDDHDLTYEGAARDVSLFDLGFYAARDTYWAWKLMDLHRYTMYLGPAADEEPEDPEEIELARLGRLATWVVTPTVRTLTEMEQRGMHLDVAWTRERLEEYLEQKHAAEATLIDRYQHPALNPADASFAATSNWFRAWTEVAVQAGDLVVGELTPNGRPRWGKSTLIRQERSGSPVAGILLEQRRASKRAEYLRSWLNLVSPEHKIHTEYRVGSVVTGRLASGNPNMQQVTAALKPAFTPSPGHAIAELDYSQIELRVAAFVSRCEPMLEAFRRGDDLHRLLAQQIAQRDENNQAQAESRRPRVVRLEDVRPDQRQAAKSANFGLLYGMGAFGFRLYAEDVYDISFTMEEAVEIYRAFFDTWEGIGQWHRKATERVRATGQVVSPIGRVRRLPDVWDGNERRAGHAERAGVNAPVQGFASDLMQMAAADIEGLMPGSTPVKDVRLVGTVHDSILVEVPLDDWEKATQAAVDRMLDLQRYLDRLGCLLDVPLAVEAKVGTRWGLTDVGVIEA